MQGIFNTYGSGVGHSAFTYPDHVFYISIACLLPKTQQYKMVAATIRDMMAVEKIGKHSFRGVHPPEAQGTNKAFA